MNKEKSIEKKVQYIVGFFLISTIFVLSPAFFLYTPDDYIYVNDGLDMANHYQYVSLIAKDVGNIAFLGNIPMFFHLIAATIVNATNLPVGLTLNLLGLFFFLLFPFSVYKLSLFFSKDKTVSLLAAFFSATIFVETDLQSLLIGVPHRAAMAFTALILYFFLSKRFVLAGFIFGLFFIIHLSWPVAVVLILLAVALEFFQKRKIAFFGLTKFFVAALVVAVPFLLFQSANAAAHASKNLFPYPQVPYSLLGLWISPFFLPFMFGPIIVMLLALAGFLQSAKAKELFKNYAFPALWLLTIALGTQAYFVFSEFERGAISFMPGRLKAFMIFPIALFASLGTIWLAKKLKKETVVVGLVCLFVLLFSLPVFISCTTNTVMHSQAQKEFIDKVSKNINGELILTAPWLERRADIINENIIKKSTNNTARVDDRYLFFSSRKTFSPFGRVFVLQNSGDNRMKVFLEKGREDFKLVFSNKDLNLFEYKKPIASDFSLTDVVAAFAMAMNDSNAFLQQFIFLKPLELKFSSGNETACLEIFKELKAIECNSATTDFEISGERKALLSILSNYNADVFSYFALWYLDRNMLSIKPLQGKLFLEKKILSFSLPKFKKSFFLKDIGTTLQIESLGKTLLLETKNGKGQGATDLSARFIARAIKWSNPLSFSYTWPNILFGLAFAILLNFFA